MAKGDTVIFHAGDVQSGAVAIASQQFVDIAVLNSVLRPGSYRVDFGAVGEIMNRITGMEVILQINGSTVYQSLRRDPFTTSVTVSSVKFLSTASGGNYNIALRARRDGFFGTITLFDSYISVIYIGRP